jgi:hypothetical protein
MLLHRSARLAIALTVGMSLSGILVGTAAAQTTPMAPKVEAAKPAAAAAKAASAPTSENDLKRACDAKWKDEKAKTKATGWKPYFVFMAACL